MKSPLDEGDVRDAVHRQDVRGDQPTAIADHPTGDLRPTARRRAEIDHGHARAQDAILFLDFQQFVAGARTVAVALRHLHVGIVEMFFQPAMASFGTGHVLPRLSGTRIHLNSGKITAFFPRGLIMALTQEQKKQFKSIGHHLKPVLTVAENGLTEGVMAELERALNDHELIKVQFRITERDDRRALIDELCKNGSCELVQVIGKMALVYRRNAKPNRNLSNISRFSGL